MSVCAYSVQYDSVRYVCVPGDVGDREGRRVHLHVDAGRDGTKREGRGQMRGRQNEVELEHRVSSTRGNLISGIAASLQASSMRRFVEDQAAHGTSLQLCNPLASRALQHETGDGGISSGELRAHRGSTSSTEQAQAER